MKKALMWSLLLIVGGLVACGPQVPEGMAVASGILLQSDKQRVESPEIAVTDQEILSNGNSAFAFALYHELKSNDGNLFYSPYSISLALAMAYAGARGDTERQMAAALHFDLPQENLHPAFNWLSQELAARGEYAEGKDEKGFRLNVANAIWGQKDFKFMVAFLDTLAENYGAGLRILDFYNESEKSRITINDWISEQTEGRIKELLAPPLDPSTTLILTNAIYFNAAWANRFIESMTADHPFYLLNGESVTVSMMQKQAVFGYATGNNYQVVELPYSGNELSMVILLPQSDYFPEFESSLDSAEFADIIDRLKRETILLKMPKFTYRSSYGLSGTLQSLGMKGAFMLGADFSGMTGNKDLFIGGVVHKAFIDVDEKGTEAAAATGVTMIPSATSPSLKPIEITIDRPFIFFIRDIQTDTILFEGRVVDPTRG